MSTIALTLDKSTFQKFSYEEITHLHHYYLVNITPILIAEILGDLAKEEKEGRPSPKDHVANLAKKLFPFNSVINMHFKFLIEKSLFGEHLELDNRPYLEAKNSINSSIGKGLLFTETKEEAHIKRWRNKQFNKIDELISNEWRVSSHADAAIEDFKSYFNGNYSHIRNTTKKGDTFQNLQELKLILDEVLNNETNQKKYLQNLIEYFDIDVYKAGFIFSRWERGEYKSIKEFSPYAFYCYEVVLSFYVGLNNKLFGERKTNILDMEYLFYAPFSKVFSSDDKFLITLFKLIKPNDVEFIDANDLKTDLVNFVKNSPAHEFAKTLPDENSKTFKIWDKNFDLELSKKLKSTEKDIEYAKEHMDKILKTVEEGNVGNFEGEPDFIVRQRYVDPNDPCSCGSGKLLKDCHLKDIKM